MPVLPDNQHSVQSRLGKRILRVVLAIGVDRAALADKITLVVNVIAKQVAELACHAVVVLPRGIQAVHFAAPCVEAPVDAAAFAFAVDDKGREAGHARCRTAPPSTERSCVRFKWFRSRAERLCVRHRRLTVTNRHVQTRSSGSLHAAQIPRAYKTRPVRV